MATKLHTISLPQELSEYVEEDPELSLSKILQNAIRDIMERRNTDPLIQRLRKLNKTLQDEVQRLNGV